jgi:hypothetical protein
MMSGIDGQFLTEPLRRAYRPLLYDGIFEPGHHTADAQDFLCVHAFIYARFRPLDNNRQPLTIGGLMFGTRSDHLTRSVTGTAR